MFLPSTRQLQRVEAKSYDPKEYIIDISIEAIQARLNNFSRISDASSMATASSPLVISMIFDATKVVQQLSICPRTKLGLGYAWPNQLKVFENEQEMKMAIEISNSTTNQTTLATKMKYIMITGQNILSSVNQSTACKFIAYFVCAL